MATKDDLKPPLRWTPRDRERTLAEQAPVERPYRPSFPLATAMLCVNCEQVYADAGDCPVCGSPERYPILQAFEPRRQARPRALRRPQIKKEVVVDEQKADVDP